MKNNDAFKILKTNIQAMLVFIKHVLYKFYKDRCLIRASGMAYSSLLSLVPFSALVFSLLTAFGVFDRLKDSIQTIVFQQLLPMHQNDIIEYINIFIENTKTLGVVGLLLFTLTSVFLISNIQGNFNDIWNVRNKKNFFGKFSVYITVIFISTLFTGSGFALTGWIKSAAAEITFLKINLLIQYFIIFLPKLLFSITLFILILAVPSVKVRLPGAFAGAVTGGLLMWTVKNVFASWSTTAVKYSIIYGSIALIPIFLIWLYIIWLVILLSVEISYVWQNGGVKDARDNEYSLFMKFHELFELYLLIAEVYSENKGGISLDDISEQEGMSGKYSSLLSLLEHNKLIYRIENGRTVFIPQTPPHSTETVSVIKKITGYHNVENGKSFYEKIAARLCSEFSEDHKYISSLLKSHEKDSNGQV